jgi:hypothetical protein
MSLNGGDGRGCRCSRLERNPDGIVDHAQSAVKKPMRVNLLRAVRAMIRADSHPVRQALFAGLSETSRSVRAVCWAHERLDKNLASSLLISAYGLKSWLMMASGSRRRPTVAAVAVHANARRQVQRVAAAFGTDQVDQMRTGPSALVDPSWIARLLKALLLTRSVRRCLRLVHQVNQRNDFLVSCRVASVLGCYARARELLAVSRPQGVLVSSDSNPEELGLVGAAKAMSIPTIFVSHAYTTSVSPPLDFSLSVLEGEASVAAHARKGPIKGRVFLCGVAGPSRPMDASRLMRPEPVIGIFAPKVAVGEGLKSIIDDCRKRFSPRQIVIRWHPSSLAQPNLTSLLEDVSGIVETRRSATLLDVASRCDWVIADSGSNVNLEVLKLGIPAVAVRELGTLDAEQIDQYGFVRNGILAPPVATLMELSVENTIAFYSKDWATRFRRYDAGYLQAGEAVSTELASAIRRVLREPSPSQPRMAPV